MLMEFFGPNLENCMLKRGGRLDEGLVLKLGIQMIERVRHIHSRGYIHRDLRP
jgi:serine/threonine protein kinase